ncbi:GMC family oxidoreductase [Halomonas sp. EGI 63088]|uniref:GMC family oxidoreductase n=1 Tax=Halomonas flagellata TaxID=2920385 RepID=A0ABS9RWW3_9GAMM|nr:GMC family oxidoreductase [Halomonas flagellata]MCH4564342.1 GMC family oxidoreductase [Halomonas flagellata]
MAVTDKFYDVVIVGAGVGGGAMANRLANAGARVLVVERGNYLPREADNWSVKAVFHDKKYTTQELWRDKSGNAFNPSTFYFVGGNSKFFGAATVRFRKEDFEVLEHEAGVSPAWPISYEDFAPYYDEAERLMGTHGTAGEDPIEPPRSGPYPHPAIGHEPEIEAIAKKLRSKGVQPFSLPIAIDRHEGGKCIRCATCDGFACKLGAKNDAEVRLVGPALKTGLVDLVLDTKVLRFLTDTSGKKVTGIEVEQDDQKNTIHGDIFISAAGAINSAALLLRSANQKHPNGLGNNSSDQLGRNYMAHNNTAMMAIHPFRKNGVTFQKSLCINDFYLSNNVRPYPLGNVQGLGKLQGGMLSANVPFIPEWLMDHFAKRSVDWWIMSEDLPDPENRITLDSDGTIRVSYTSNNLKAHQELVKHWGKIMRSLGYPLILTQKMDITVSMHQCGTARFGTDPATSVLDQYSRVWDLDNLYVVDASFLPSSTGFNPSLTIVAQAVRVSEHLIANVLRSTTAA